ncbi:heterokaryon incompatibility protein-domain-containing protein [Staphylotrichum tortipilum]|uniref:Heterokaryon incompatibility protein-domain-containing protein n=1 Tax=Staphylotrichum tortipilum TaxID=2831512 RepID=A0AAN6MAK8_9PEZI|nr:heterokaryon incompatibility protein-domain-containing protein [Staphylotrichum longicolle]
MLQYNPLAPGHIRLLHILPGPFDSRVECKLFHVSLDTKKPWCWLPRRWGSRYGGPPRYRALSYVWGHRNNQPNITVDGHDVSVTVNLEAALRRLRAHHAIPGGAPLVIWADAVCINQDDVVERGMQVALMGRIYKSCAEVCIWLGPFGHEHEPACLDAAALSQTSFPARPGPISAAESVVLYAKSLVALASASHLHEVALFSDKSTIDAITDAVRALSDSSWFTRGWVVQEGLLPSKTAVYFGPAVLGRELLWDACASHSQIFASLCDCCGPIMNTDFFRTQGPFFNKLAGLAVIRQPRGSVFRKLIVALAMIRLPVGLPGPFLLLARPFSWILRPFNKLAAVAAVSRSVTPGLATRPFSALLERSIVHRRQSVTDPLDHIYAYQGLVEDWLGGGGGTGLPQPNLSERPDELFQRVCTDAALREGYLEFLAWDLRKLTYAALPSWAPDWTRLGVPDDATWMFASKQWKSAKGIPADTAALEAGGRVLVVQGVQVDTVSDGIGELWSSVGVTRMEDSPLHNAGLWQSWIGAARLRDDPDRLYPTGERWSSIWWKALCFDSETADPKRTPRERCALELVSVLTDWLHMNFLPFPGLTRECEAEYDGPGFDVSPTRQGIVALVSETFNPIRGYMEVMLEGCRLFVTSGGYLGFARDGIKKGDAVFLVGGCRAPVVMRKLEKTKDLNGQPTFVVVSGVYIYGVMDGELAATRGHEAAKLYIR